jgi:hypothetical protein
VPSRIKVNRRLRSRAFWTPRGAGLRTLSVFVGVWPADVGDKAPRLVRDAVEIVIGTTSARYEGIVVAAGKFPTLVTLREAVPTSHGELSVWSGLNPSIRTHGHPRSLRFSGRTDELAIPRHNTWFQHESPIQAFD